MGTRKMKAIELVLDWNLWPRHESGSLDSANIRGMREAIRAGIELPPVVINANDNRVIDGFHRVKAHLLELGDEAKIKVNVQVYDTEADMFSDAIRYNAHHGLPLSPKDRAHAIIKARRLKVPMSAIAMALSVTETSLRQFIEKRTATASTGEDVALGYGAKDLAGKKLTEKQTEYAYRSDGRLPIMHANNLLRALQAEAMPLTEKAIITLRELWDEIGRVLKEADND
jgi:hypothetical protein